MDDERNALRRRMAVVVAVFALAVLAEVQLAGARAVAPLVLAALVATALVVRRRATGHSLLPQPATADVPRQREPEWYSERWVPGERAAGAAVPGGVAPGAAEPLSG